MKTSQNQNLLQKSDQRNKYLGSLLCKIPRTLLKMDKRGNQTYGPKIACELWKRLKLDHNDKRYKHKIENDAHKILKDFEIQGDDSIYARRPDIVAINKKKRTCCLVDFAVPADHRVKVKENENIR